MKYFVIVEQKYSVEVDADTPEWAEHLALGAQKVNLFEAQVVCVEPSVNDDDDEGLADWDEDDEVYEEDGDDLLFG